MIEPGMPERDDANGAAPPASTAGRVFGAVVMVAFLVLWLTMTIGMSRFASGFAPGIFSVVPLLMALVGTLVIGGGIVGILTGQKPPMVGRRGSESSRADAETIKETSACAYCGVRGEATRTKCPVCGAPNRD